MYYSKSKYYSKSTLVYHSKSNYVFSKKSVWTFFNINFFILVIFIILFVQAFSGATFSFALQLTFHVSLFIFWVFRLLPPRSRRSVCPLCAAGGTRAPACHSFFDSFPSSSHEGAEFRFVLAERKLANLAPAVSSRKYYKFASFALVCVRVHEFVCVCIRLNTFTWTCTSLHSSILPSPFRLSWYRNILMRILDIFTTSNTSVLPLR